MFFLSCQPPLCPTFMLPAEIATPAHALHGYCNVLSPDDPKTHPSRCQHYGPWSPQGIDTRPASKDPDSKGYHSQLSDSDSSWKQLFGHPGHLPSFHRVSPESLWAAWLWSPTEAPLKIYSGKWTFKSCLPSCLIRCAWKYSHFAGVKNLRSHKESHCISLKILRLSANLHKIFFGYINSQASVTVMVIQLV